jgi:UDP-glucose:(heptosyl)LPS alpha-1,3-glucosyltransferase
MKIGLIVEWLDAGRGGAETSAGEFIDELIARDVNVEVFTRSTPAAKPGVDAHTYLSRAPTRAGRTLQYVNAAERWLRQARCDLIHALIPCDGADIYQPRGGLLPETIARTLASRPPGFARWWKRLDLATNRRQRLLLRRERDWLTGPRKPMVIAISEYVFRQLRDHYDYPETHIRHILNGANIEAVDEESQAAARLRVRRGLGLSRGDFLVLQVCHNFRLKGVGAAVQAVARASDSQVTPITLLVAGNGNRRPYEKLAKQLGIGDRVAFTGPVQSVADLMHAADVLLHPTYYDPCSRVVLEAVGRGLPVISTRFDGASEIIEEGKSGFVADSPNAIGELADYLGVLSQKRPERIAPLAPTATSRRVSMWRHAEEVWALYRRLV